MLLLGLSSTMDFYTLPISHNGGLLSPQLHIVYFVSKCTKTSKQAQYLDLLIRLWKNKQIYLKSILKAKFCGNGQYSSTAKL